LEVFPTMSSCLGQRPIERMPRDNTQHYSQVT